MPAPVPKSLPLSCIIQIPDLQMRAGGLDESHAEDLVKVLKRGKSLPRVRIVKIEAKSEDEHVGLYCVGGFHTLRAHELASRKHVPCSISEGTWEDALYLAGTSNQGKFHQSLKPNRADKHRAVEMLLQSRPHYSDRKVGEDVGIDHETVGKIRKELEKAAKIQPTEVREGSDGREQKATKPARPKTAAKPLAEGDDGVARGKGEMAEKAKFDWKSVEMTMGVFFKNLHGMAKFHGCEKNLKFVGIDRMMREIGESFRALKDELKKQK